MCTEDLMCRKLGSKEEMSCWKYHQHALVQIPGPARSLFVVLLISVVLFLSWNGVNL